MNGSGTQIRSTVKPPVLNHPASNGVLPNQNLEPNLSANQRRLSIPGRQSIFSDNSAQRNTFQEGQSQMYGFPIYNPAESRRGPIPCPPVNKNQQAFDQQIFGSFGGHVNVTHNPQDAFPSPLPHGPIYMYGQSCPPYPAPNRVVKPNQLGRPAHLMTNQNINGLSRISSRSPTNGGHLSSSMNEFHFQTTNPEQLEDKQKKRKESHNAVERRRRDHINEMIQKLAAQVAPKSSSEERSRLNKGEVLEKSVKLIENLSRIVQIQKSRLLEIDPTFAIVSEEEEDDDENLTEQNEDSS